MSPINLGRKTGQALMVAALVVAGGAAWAFLAAGSAPAPAVEVKTAPVSIGSVVHRVVAAGTMEAVATVDVGAQVSGTIQSLDADFNTAVRKGQVLARLDPAVYEAQLARAHASLAQARAEVARRQAALADATTKRNRAQELARAGLATQADLETAQATASQASADLKSAQSSVVVAQASLQQAQVNLEYTTVRSPIDGIVVSRQVEVGQTVAVRRDIPVFFTIAQDFKHLTLEEAIDESDVSYVRAGQPVTFTVSAFPGETFTGVLSQVRLQPDQTATLTDLPNGLMRAREPRVITYTAVVDVANADERLRPGMTAIATTEVAQCGSCTRVPNDALAFKPSDDVLRALEQDPRAFPDLPAEGVGRGKPAAVWHYEGDRLVPAVVYVGAEGDQYTEILGGSLDTSRPIVTSARLPVAQLPTARSPFTPQRPRFGGRFRGFR